MAARLDGQRIVVTGGSGFIGRAAVRQLVDAGVQVTALLRHNHGAASLRAAGALPVVAPLRSGARLDRALAGADVLVNLAYDVRADAGDNLAAFDALLGAAMRAGVGRIVHASSVVVYDEWPASDAGGATINEGSSIGKRAAQGYRAAKIEMERRLLAGACPAVILQPTIVWGAGSALWTDGPIRRMRAGGLVLPDPCGAAPLVHVEDVAAAVVAASAHGPSDSRRVLLVGPDRPRWDTLFEGYRAIAGGTLLREPAARLLSQAAPAVMPQTSRPDAAARISAALRSVVGNRNFERLRDAAARFTPMPPPARPGPADLALFTATPLIDGRLANDLLGFSPRIGLHTGLTLLRETVASPGQS